MLRPFIHIPRSQHKINIFTVILPFFESFLQFFFRRGDAVQLLLIPRVGIFVLAEFSHLFTELFQAFHENIDFTFPVGRSYEQIRRCFFNILHGCTQSFAPFTTEETGPYFYFGQHIGTLQFINGNRKNSIIRLFVQTMPP